jgi:hypothetical protein
MTGRFDSINKLSALYGDRRAPVPHLNETERVRALHLLSGFAFVGGVECTNKNATVGEALDVGGFEFPEAGSELVVGPYFLNLDSPTDQPPDYMDNGVALWRQLPQDNETNS